jgi:hypothetical protein
MKKYILIIGCILLIPVTSIFNIANADWSIGFNFDNNPGGMATNDDIYWVLPVGNFNCGDVKWPYTTNFEVEPAKINGNPVGDPPPKKITVNVPDTCHTSTITGSVTLQEYGTGTSMCAVEFSCTSLEGCQIISIPTFSFPCHADTDGAHINLYHP